MATAIQIKELLNSVANKDKKHFKTIALQMAANEARKGHDKLARDIESIISKIGDQSEKLDFIFEKTKAVSKKISIDISDLIEVKKGDIHLNQLFLEDDLKEQIKNLFLEYKNKDNFSSYGLDFKRKIILGGPPGTGKTMSAEVLATELKLPLYNIPLDKIISKYMGETSSKFRAIFEYMFENKGVYFFDEFDAIASDRSKDNDVGEVRRILNSFLQLIEQDNSQSFIIVATNHLDLIDNALFRRFDDYLFYEIPNVQNTDYIINNFIAFFTSKKIEGIYEYSKGLSHSDIKNACCDAIKEAILAKKKYISKKSLIKSLEGKRKIYKHLRSE